MTTTTPVRRWSGFAASRRTTRRRRTRARRTGCVTRSWPGTRRISTATCIWKITYCFRKRWSWKNDWRETGTCPAGLKSRPTSDSRLWRDDDGRAPERDLVAARLRDGHLQVVLARREALERHAEPHRHGLRLEIQAVGHRLH